MNRIFGRYLHSNNNLYTKEINLSYNKSYLSRVALGYLSRYNSSASNLKRILRRRVQLKKRVQFEDDEERDHMIDEIIVNMMDMGMLDDQVYASNQLRMLRDRGRSKWAIQSKLLQKGVHSNIIDETFNNRWNELNVDAEEDERKSAETFVRKHKLGPYAIPLDDPLKEYERYQRDLQRLARQGFSYHVAKVVLKSNDNDDDE